MFNYLHMCNILLVNYSIYIRKWLHMEYDNYKEYFLILFYSVKWLKCFSQRNEQFFFIFVINLFRDSEYESVNICTLRIILYKLTEFFKLGDHQKLWHLGTEMLKHFRIVGDNYIFLLHLLTIRIGKCQHFFVEKYVNNFRTLAFFN